jgi:hypothetical protein
MFTYRIKEIDFVVLSVKGSEYLSSLIFNEII